jgi:hypothetical protein
MEFRNKEKMEELAVEPVEVSPELFLRRKAPLFLGRNYRKMKELRKQGAVQITTSNKMTLNPFHSA